jgi:ABC-type transport system substrate-binding protein
VRFVKLLLVCLSVAVFAHSSRAADTRYYGFEPTGSYFILKHVSPILPQQTLFQEIRGTLTASKLGSINSVQPYAYDKGVFQRRPQFIDDLMYESLLLDDPSQMTDRMYPLIASSIRIANDLSYVVFEIDPSARFNDGVSVLGSHVYHSYMIYKESHPDAAKYLAAVVGDIKVGEKSIEFGLTVRGQQAREAIMRLARIKIVKPNTTGNQSMGGIAVRYTGSGPYTLTRLSAYRSGMIRNQFYWADYTPMRKGFFNFREIGEVAYATPDLAASALVGGQVNFHHEKRQWTIRDISDRLYKALSTISLVIDSNRVPGEPLRSYAFNLDRAQIADYRVRQALLLAYDFSLINQLYHVGELERPLSLLHGSVSAPAGVPSDSVKALIATCALPSHATGSFQDYGNSLFNKLSDKRTRLLEVSRLIREAGYTLINGKFTRRDSTGKEVPMALKIVAADANDQTRMILFANELSKLGIDATLVSPADQTEFEKVIASNDYDIAPADERLLSRDLEPTLPACFSTALSPTRRTRVFRI